MDTSRAVNGRSVSRDQLKGYTIADKSVLDIVERARRRGERSGHAQ